MSLPLALFFLFLFLPISLFVSPSPLSVSLYVSCFLSLSPLFLYPLILTPHNLPPALPATPVPDTLAGPGLPTPLMAGAQPPPPLPSYHSPDRDKVYLEAGGYESSLSAAPLE